MTNREISKILQEIGEMLEILGEEKDHFRIIAYENAARKVDMMSEELEDIYRHSGREGLRSISGIGESISQVIEELLRTHKSYYHNQLVKSVPAPILEFTKIPGVGPHTAKNIFECYKIKTISELKNVLQKDKSEKCFKEKTRLNILEGIELMQGQTGRMLLSFAEPIASEIVVALQTMPEVKQAYPVGSLRRMKETIGDIDIVASSSDSRVTIDKFIQLPFVERVISHGDTKATIIHKKGPNIDLEILPEENYGSLLQHFTGSKDHNIALRTWAERHGFSLSEHGIKAKSKLVKCETEQKLYKTFGMDTPAPELRENRGEIEAALKHKLPKLLELKNIKGDLHLHSTWSEGENSIEEVAKAAQKLGYEYMAITDHTAGLGITHGLKEKDISRYIKEIDKINQKLHATGYKLHVLSGVEANIMADGSLDISDQMLSKLDVVVASIHSGFRQSKDKITERLIRAMKNPNVDIIGHPSGRLLEKRQPLNLDWEKVFEAAKENSVIMEINSQPDRLDLSDDLIIAAKKYNLKFVISTDSHHLVQLENMRYGVATARRGWLEKKNVINSLSLQDILEVLKK